MFKERFKYYKSKCPPPNFDSVIQLKDPTEKVSLRKPLTVSPDIEQLCEISGLRPAVQWNIFELECHPGLIIIRNPFTEVGLRQWVERCLSKYPGPPNKCNLHNHDLLSVNENWWDVCQIDESRRKTLVKKLRWVTLGYHHDWDTKVYSECSKSPMPEELITLVKCIGRVIAGWNVRAEAAIVNFYRMDSTLSGHTDHSEPYNTAPLFSISFGQSAVFLIGGRSLEDPASAVLLESGDIMVMSGESRLCYHGVPKIVPVKGSEDNDIYSTYLKEARININIRQVLNPEQTSL